MDKGYLSRFKELETWQLNVANCAENKAQHFVFRIIFL
jgi:hypothetical protein